MATADGAITMNAETAAGVCRERRDELRKIGFPQAAAMWESAAELIEQQARDLELFAMLRRQDQATVAELEKIGVHLWKLLDDIDTASDSFKENYEGFAKSTYRRQRQRFEFLSGEDFEALADKYGIELGPVDVMRSNG